MPVSGGVRLRVRVQPRASRTECTGLVGHELKIRVAAPPVDGAANDALVRFLAALLGVPRSAVMLVAGVSSRSKVFEVRGADETLVRRSLGMEGDLGGAERRE
jgi:uncharacterized protein (TIGR00251 family)